MKYSEDDQNMINQDQIIIYVNTLMNIMGKWNFIVEKNEKILHLKQEMSKLLEISPHEMKLMIGPEYPYPLDNDLFLHNLLENHRNLHLVIEENPKQVPPKRLVIKNIQDNRKTLNLIDILDHDIQYIWRWIEHSFSDVQIKLNHPLFSQTFCEIAIGLDLLLDSEHRIRFPTKYYVYYDSNDSNDSNDISINDNQLQALRYFYKKLKPYEIFRRVKVYIPKHLSPILNHNNIDKSLEWVLLTKNNTKNFDLILSDFIWNEEKY